MLAWNVKFVRVHILLFFKIKIWRHIQAHIQNQVLFKSDIKLCSKVCVCFVDMYLYYIYLQVTSTARSVELSKIKRTLNDEISKENVKYPRKNYQQHKLLAAHNELPTYDKKLMQKSQMSSEIPSKMDKLSFCVFLKSLFAKIRKFLSIVSKIRLFLYHVRPTFQYPWHWP